MIFWSKNKVQRPHHFSLVSGFRNWFYTDHNDHTWPHLRDNKTIVVEFLFTRNTSVNLTLVYDLFFVHEFTSVHFLHHSINNTFLKICITLGSNLRNNKTIVVEFLYTRNTSLNLTLWYYNQYLVVHEFTSVHFLHHRMNNIAFHFTCITHILYDFNNIQRIHL